MPPLITYLKTSAVSLAAMAAMITYAPLAHAQQATLRMDMVQRMDMAQQSVQSPSSTSRNWAGYVAQNGQYTKVSGTWKVPAVTGGDPNSADAAWIGIGGVTSNDLIQSGTQDIIDPYGQVSSTAFYELLPDAPVTIPTVTVHPGDSVTVSIAQQQPDQWQISFTDTTDGQTYNTSVSYASSLSSAEWIEEAPSNGYSTVPLADFGSVSFTNGSTNQGSMAQSGAQPITMVDDYGQTLATPSAVSTDGASFSVSDQQQSTGTGNPGNGVSPWGNPGDPWGNGNPWGSGNPWGDPTGGWWGWW